MKILFVCLGNICRSPTAEGVFRHVVAREGLSERFEIDSAGTAAYHAGEAPDRRSTEAARRRGVMLEGQARKVRDADFATYDLLLAMDESNYENLLLLAPDDEARAKVRLFRDYDPASPEGSSVPDPYYGGPAGFDEVLDLCEAASEGLLASVRGQLDGRAMKAGAAPSGPE